MPPRSRAVNKIEKLYQTNPLEWKPTPKVKDRYAKLKGWTDTLCGYWNEAEMLCGCINLNRDKLGHDYSFDIAINFREILPPTDIRTKWARICRRLRQSGIIAFWVIEIAKSNKVHFHLLLSSIHTQKQLTAIVVKAIANENCRKHVRPIASQVMYPRYILKAKTKGYLPDGTPVKDRWAKQRMLFRKSLRLKKYGSIGPFFQPSIEKLREEIRQREETIAKTLEADPTIRARAKAAHEMTGVPLEQIVRNFALCIASGGKVEW